MVLERSPQAGVALCSQLTMSGMENLPTQPVPIQIARSMIRFYCQSFARVPRRIVLDIDDTFDAAHGHQQLRLFNAYYDEYDSSPLSCLTARDGWSGPCYGRPVDRKGWRVQHICAT